jgi:Bacterial EndoU nuclease
MRRHVLVGCLVVGAVAPAGAQSFFETPRDFLIEQGCEATRSLKTQSDPIPLSVGTVYAARGVNRPNDPTHVFIRVGSDSKWVAVSCGRFTSAAATRSTAPPPPPQPPLQPSLSCLPFFDTKDERVEVAVGGLVDITPKPPTLDTFDKALNATCGASGKIVPEAEFKDMMRTNAAVLDRVRLFTRGMVFADRPAHTSAESYLNDLTEAWFKVKAFDHIFCGEPSSGRGGKIGGLHFRGRYLQLQDNGEACRINNYRQNEVVPGVIYTMGVTMKSADGLMVRDARKGYGLTLSGEDILKLGTRAFADNATPSTDSKACLLPVVDDGQSFTTVFVRRAAGIRTLYPDATPNGRGSRERTPPCATRIDLPPN